MSARHLGLATRSLIAATVIGLPSAATEAPGAARHARAQIPFAHVIAAVHSDGPHSVFAHAVSRPSGWVGSRARAAAARNGHAPRAASIQPQPNGRTAGSPAASIAATAHILYADFLGTCLACTSAEAGAHQSGAEARGTRIANEPASEGQAPANGYTSGSLVAVPSNPLLRLAFDRSDSSSWAHSGSRGGHARATLIDFGLIEPGFLDLTAGDAQSDATSGGSGSNATTQANGAELVAGHGAVNIVVLHSDSRGGDDGHAYLASLNDETTLGSQAVTDNRVVIARVLTLGILNAEEGGADVGSARDGKSQPVVGIVSVRNGTPGSDQSEPLH